MQKNKLNLHIYGIHLLNPYKTVVSHLKDQLCSMLISAIAVEEFGMAPSRTGSHKGRS